MTQDGSERQKTVTGSEKKEAPEGHRERVEQKLSKIKSTKTRTRITFVVGFLVIVFLTYSGLLFVEFFSSISGQFGSFLASLSDFTNPDFYWFSVHSEENNLSGFSGLYESILNPSSIIETMTTGNNQYLTSAALVSIVLGFVGTVLGFPLALLFGILGSERVVPFPFNFLFRGVMSTIRSIPALVWILIYVPLATLGPVSAVLAIATDTVGNLGRLFTDELEEIEEGPIEAIDSTGASKPQTVIFGMLSQVSNGFIAWTLYIFEINVRIAISLGVLGAGGLGQYIDAQIGLGNYNQASAGIIVVILIVISVEMISSRVRARLRPSEHESTGLIETLRDLTNFDKWVTGKG